MQVLSTMTRGDGGEISAAPDASFSVTIDGGGSVITTGSLKVAISVPFDCEITKYVALADQTGSMVIDIWKDTFANYPPVDADSITASAPVTISSGTKAEDATLTGWTKALAAGNILKLNVDSCSAITWATLTIYVRKT